MFILWVFFILFPWSFTEIWLKVPTQSFHVFPINTSNATLSSQRTSHLGVFPSHHKARDLHPALSWCRWTLASGMWRTLMTLGYGSCCNNKSQDFAETFTNTFPSLWGCQLPGSPKPGSLWQAEPRSYRPMVQVVCIDISSQIPVLLQWSTPRKGP